jgi:hypothetical protein
MILLRFPKEQASANNCAVRKRQAPHEWALEDSVVQGIHSVKSLRYTVCMSF